MFPTLCFHHPSSPITSLSPPGIAAGLPASRSTAHSKRAKEGTSQLEASRDTNPPSLTSEEKKNSCYIFPHTNLLHFFLPDLGKACSRMLEPGRLTQHPWYQRSIWDPLLILIPSPQEKKTRRRAIKNPSIAAPLPNKLHWLEPNCCDPKAREWKEQKENVLGGSQTITNKMSSAPVHPRQEQRHRVHGAAALHSTKPECSRQLL